jgi:sulfocyanin
MQAMKAFGMAGGAAAVAMLLVSGCGGQTGSQVSPGMYTSTPVAPGSSGGGPQQYMTVDQAGKSVTLKVVAGATNALGGFNFDGHGNGNLKITVPSGWKVTVQCSNAAAVPHSCAVVKGGGTDTLAFQGASSPNPATGLTKGQSATFSFTPDTPGTYRIACLVPGHEDAGMWIAFVVASGGAPSISASS